MQTKSVKLAKPLSPEEFVVNAPDLADALGWSIQSISRDTVSAMVLLATSLSDHYRYAVAVSPDIADYLTYLPDGATTAKDIISINDIGGVKIGLFDMMDLYSFQVDNEESYVALLILNDDKLVDSYILSRLRPVEDHVVHNIIPKSKAV